MDTTRSHTRSERAKKRRIEAQNRMADRALRTDKEQLEVLYNRGINCGREYDRLVARIKADEAGKKGKK